MALIQIINNLLVEGDKITKKLNSGKKISKKYA